MDAAKVEEGLLVTFANITMRKLKTTELNRLSVEDFQQVTKNPIRLVLDNIRSHHNVGSIFRTSDALAIEGIDLCGYTPIPPHREIHKTALGATESVSWAHFEKTTDRIQQLLNEGYSVFALEQTEDSTTLQDLSVLENTPIAVVLGNEVSGVDQEVIDLCKGVIEIPQFGTKHSFNVSVSTGILLWELTKPFIKQS